MDDVKLNLNDKGHGAFYIMDGAEQMGEMVVGISGSNLTVYHTEVSTKAEGKGYAKKMLNCNGRTCTNQSPKSNSALSLCSCSI